MSKKLTTCQACLNNQAGKKNILPIPHTCGKENIETFKAGVDKLKAKAKTLNNKHIR